jgi:hypothetical protein
LKDGDEAEQQLPDCFRALNENAWYRQQAQDLVTAMERMARDPKVIAAAAAQEQRYHEQKRDGGKEWEEQRCTGVQRCEGCGCKGSAEVRLKKCTACEKVVYCSRECQHADWRLHKVVCRTLRQQHGAGP